MVESAEWSEQDLADFMACVRAELGIKMPAGKALMLQSRILRRLRQLSLDSLEAYRERLFASPYADEERIHFLDLVTTNHTSFFREPQHLEHLRRMAARAHGFFAVWSAGCSSGEEAYTIAMVLAEEQERNPRLQYAVLATDVSTAMLERAESGIYDRSRAEAVPAELRWKYLLRSRDASRGLVRVAPELRAAVRFHRLNFMEEDYGVEAEMDAIFFRNVMIYFDKPTQARVVNRLCRHLRPRGLFFTGHSESVAGLAVPLDVVAPAVYRRSR
jgi:chemotaxis protein methyltransferase CheR